MVESRRHYSKTKDKAKSSQKHLVENRVKFKHFIP